MGLRPFVRMRRFGPHLNTDQAANGTHSFDEKLSAAEKHPCVDNLMLTCNRSACTVARASASCTGQSDLQKRKGCREHELHYSNSVCSGTLELTLSWARVARRGSAGRGRPPQVASDMEPAARRRSSTRRSVWRGRSHCISRAHMRLVTLTLWPHRDRTVLSLRLRDTPSFSP